MDFKLFPKNHALNNTIFPLLAKIKNPFEYLKRQLEGAVVPILDEENTLEIENYGSYVSLSDDAK